MILADAIQQALSLLLGGNPVLWQIIGLSLQVSLAATGFSLLLGLPCALVIALYRFPGRRLLMLLVDTFMALPPVVVGLMVYLLLSRAGPLGVLGLLYTPTAMIIAQTLLITPIVIALALQLFASQWQRLGDQLQMLGYRRHHCWRLLLHETRLGLITVALAAGGRALAEIGTVMIVGGNIEHHTRVMTTAIAMETRQGNLAMALALGLVLILLALVITLITHRLKRPLEHRR